MRGALLGCAGVLIALTLGCGGGSDSSGPEVIEEDPPSFKGLTVDEPVPGDVEEILGARCDQGSEVTPCDLDAVTGPHAIRGEWSFENYPEVTLLTSEGEIQALLIAASDAETTRGVGIGDALSSSEDRYDGLECGVQQSEDSTGNPYCLGNLGGKIWVLFGGDPIDSILIGRGFR